MSISPWASNSLSSSLLMCGLCVTLISEWNYITMRLPVDSNNIVSVLCIEVYGLFDHYYYYYVIYKLYCHNTVSSVNHIS